MSLDARSRYTKMVITNSFIKLLNTKPFYRIKLKDVCDLAEIGRHGGSRSDQEQSGLPYLRQSGQCTLADHFGQHLRQRLDPER